VRDVSGRARIGAKNGERNGIASLFDISASLRSRECSGLAGSWNRSRNDFTAINQFIRVVANDSEFSHGCLEVRGHQLLLVDLLLPLASGTFVTGDEEIGLKTQLSLVLTTVLREGRCSFTAVVAQSGESSTLEKNFEEDLSIEGEGRRIEGHILDSRVDMVSTSGGVRG